MADSNWMMDVDDDDLDLTMPLYSSQGQPAAFGATSTPATTTSGFPSLFGTPKTTATTGLGVAAPTPSSGFSLGGTPGAGGFGLGATPTASTQASGFTLGGGTSTAATGSGFGFGLTPAASTAAPDLETSEKIQRLSLYLRSQPMKGNAIENLMNATTGSKIMCDYEAEELAKVGKKKAHTGCLKLAGVFLAREVSFNRKELKHLVFQKALNVLLTKTVAEIYNLVDPGVNTLREELERNEEIENTKKDMRSQDWMGQDIREAIQNIVDELKNNAQVVDSDISRIEHAIVAVQCVIRHQYNVDTLKHRNGRVTFKGSLEINNIIVGRARATNKKACKRQTYYHALERLLTKSIEELMIPVPEIEPEPEEEPSKPPKPPRGVKRGFNLLTMSKDQKRDTDDCLTCELYLDNTLNTSGKKVDFSDQPVFVPSTFPRNKKTPCMTHSARKAGMTVPQAPRPFPRSRSTSGALTVSLPPQPPQRYSMATTTLAISPQPLPLFTRSTSVPASMVPSPSTPKQPMFPKQPMSMPGTPSSISENPVAGNESNECKVCYERPVNSVLYTCGHMCMCFECAQAVRKEKTALCPICRQEIKDVIKIYRS